MTLGNKLSYSLYISIRLEIHNKHIYLIEQLIVPSIRLLVDLSIEEPLWNSVNTPVEGLIVNIKKHSTR